MAESDEQKEPYVYTPSEAVKYLAEKRGIYLSVTALRVRRNRKKAQASRVLGRTSLWTKEELDAIEPSKRGKKRTPPESSPLEDKQAA